LRKLGNEHRLSLAVACGALFDQEADLTFLRFRRGHRLPHGGEQRLDARVVRRHRSFQFIQFEFDLSLRLNGGAEPNERAHHVNTHPYRMSAIERGRGHDRAVLGKSIGQVLDVLAAFQDHRL